MKRTFDTLFVRLSLMTVGLIVAGHFMALLLIDQARARIDAQRSINTMVVAAQVREQDPALADQVARTLGIQYVGVDKALAAGCPAPCTDTNGPFEETLRPKLGPGSHVLVESDNGNVWVRRQNASYWIVIPAFMPPLSHFMGFSVLTLMGAVIVAVLFAWQVQRPVRALARAAREYRIGRGVHRVAEAGPRELRELASDFNDMVSELAEAERERSVMLAGIAHDLRTPITRLQLRSDLLAIPADRAAFLRETESMSRIVTQFLDFARESVNQSAFVGVEEHCRRDYGAQHDDDALVKLDLRAGEGFQLPAVDLDRILSNLIENALTYGEPPVEVSTSKEEGRYVLRVRDHGAGVPEDDLHRVQRPFVRLDAARSGEAHCGLGLAIVRRLVRHHDGTMVVSNAAQGGFVVTMSFPYPRKAA
ncbi:ATP-binding protein [Paraburkholderia bannensis]|uniref:ATP-binding protein n=1 Tax=Paraburkholderia bannensis TaxID=765414 RepID=UPI002AC33D35|nr:ATP-binding protein [Paraburkholderia bannensis]